MGEKKVSLKEYILETVPKKLGLTLDTMSELEKARYIYIEICKVFSYNNIYNILDDENKKQNIFDEDIDINKYYIDIEHPYQNKLICSHMAKLYIELLKLAGISNCSTVDTSSGSARHMEAQALLNIGNRKINFTMDPILDLANIQTGFLPEYFESDPPIISEVNALLFEIDKKIGYTLNGLYLDEAIAILSDEIKQIYNCANSNTLSNDIIKIIASFLQLEGSTFPYKYKQPIINDIQNQENNTLISTFIRDKDELLCLFKKELCKIFDVTPEKFSYNDIPIYTINFLSKLFKYYHLGASEGNDFFSNLKSYFNVILNKQKAKYNNLTFVLNNSSIIKFYILNDSLYILSDGNFAKKIILKRITEYDNGISISYIDPTINPYRTLSLNLTNYHNRSRDSKALLDFYRNQIHLDK